MPWFVLSLSLTQTPILTTQRLLTYTQSSCCLLTCVFLMCTSAKMRRAIKTWQISIQWALSKHRRVLSHARNKTQGSSWRRSFPESSRNDYKSSSITRGSSTADLIFRKKVTASRPSTSLWSYVSATYIMGRTSTCGQHTRRGSLSTCGGHNMHTHFNAHNYIIHTFPLCSACHSAWTF